MDMNKYIDFDKNNELFYYNLYSKDVKFVIKIPIYRIKNKNSKKEIKIEKFDLTKYTFLLNCKKKDYPYKR